MCFLIAEYFYKVEIFSNDRLGLQCCVSSYGPSMGGRCRLNNSQAGLIAFGYKDDLSHLL